jgi:hypothetical protein
MFNRVNYDQNSIVSSNSFYLFFSSSILSADMFNRFFIKNEFFNSIFTKGLDQILVEFNFKLPFLNNFSKFKNRIHFLLYYLFFELVVGQKPQICLIKGKTSTASIKNKRDLKKSQILGLSAVELFSFRSSLLTFNSIMFFLNFIIFFLAVFSNKRLTNFSKLVPITVETSQTAVTGLIKNFSIFNFFNLIEDLSGSSLEFNFKIKPLSGNHLKIDFIEKILLFYSNSIGLSVSSSNFFNLRKNSFI